MSKRNKMIFVLVLAASAILAVGEASAGNSDRMTSNSASDDWRTSVLERAPVANPSDIPKGSSLWRAHQEGQLTYGGSRTQKLFSLQNPITGQLEGFDATMALLLAKYLTGKPAVTEKIVTSATRESLLNNNSLDAVFYTYSITPARDKKVDFAGPYFISGQAIVVRDTTDDIKQLGDLAARKVCVTKGGTAYLTMTKRVPSADLVTLESSTECEAILRQGRVDAEVQDRAVLLGQVAKGGLKLVGDTMTYEPYGIGLPNNSAESVAFVNEWLNKLIKSGLWQEVADHTIGQVKGADVTVPEPGKNVTPKLHLN